MARTTASAVVSDEDVVRDAEAVIRDKMIELERAVKGDVVERDEEAHGINAALVARQHVFLYGTPGIAKTFLLDRFLIRILGVNTFKTLMDAFKKPEAVFGPLDMALLKASRYAHLTDGYMPWADVAFMTEIWKANSAILQSLLMIINERLFFNDGPNGPQNYPVPLGTLVCDSNELPQNEALAAIYDRILLRYQVKEVQETGNLIAVLAHEPDPNPAPIVTWNEVEAAQGFARQLPIAQSVFEGIAELRSQLKEKNIEPTTRRLKQMLSILRAEAWLDESPMVEREHLSMAQHILWDRPDQAADVKKVVLDLANPTEKESLDLLQAIEGIGGQIDRAVRNEADKVRMGSDIHRDIDRAKDDLRKLQAKAGTSRRQAELLRQAKTNLHRLTVRMITEIFNLPLDQVDAEA